MTILETKDLRKIYGSGDAEVRALDGVNLTVENGEFVAVVGTSGSGKSTLLHMLGGLDRPTGGAVMVDGKDIFTLKDEALTIFRRRKIGFVFQNYNLVPVLNVYENIVLPIHLDGAGVDTAYVDQIIQVLGLESKLQNLPNNLSGGQQQRVALARILVSDPQILLLDEPFSALDSHLRFRLEQDLRQVIRRFGKTVLLVSHDRDEVFRLSDRIAVMDGGRIQALGGKHAVFADPQTRSAAVLTGCKNISAVKLLDETHVQALDWGITLSLPRPVRTLAAIGIRMHDVCLDSGPNSFRCQVAEVIENPFSYTLMLRPLGAEHAVPLGLELGKAQWDQLRADTLTVSLPPEKLLLLEAL